jgi:hypothetical protein
MKRIILIFSLLATAFSPSFAQSEDYTATMKTIVDSIQTAKRGADLTPYANQLERTAAVETKEWLPNYWAAYCYMTKSYGEKAAEKRDALLEKAETFAAVAEKLNPANDEIEVLKANIANARMAVDPQNRWQKYGDIMSKAMDNAEKLNPQNPRLKMLEGQGYFFKPEAYGGGKKKALVIFEDAALKFDSFKPTSALMPNWGLNTLKYFIAEARKK